MSNNTIVRCQETAEFMSNVLAVVFPSLSGSNSKTPTKLLRKASRQKEGLEMWYL